MREIPRLPNGGNPLIERATGAVKDVFHGRAKVNWGYIALIGTLGPAAFLVVWGAIHGQTEMWQGGVDFATKIGAPVVGMVIVGNVATKRRREEDGSA